MVEYWLTVINNFAFFPKKRCEKGLAVKSQIFILSVSILLPNVKQLETRKEKTAISDP